MHVYLVATTAQMQRQVTAEALRLDPLCQITVIHRSLFRIESGRLTAEGFYFFWGVTHAVEITGREEALALYTWAR